MTESSLEAISAGLGTALAKIDDLEVHDLLGGTYNLPCVIVDVPLIEEYMISMGRTGDITVPFDVTVIVGRVSDTVAISDILAYVDPAGDRSVRQALMADQTLGGLVESIYMRSYTRSIVDLGGTPALGASFSVEVTFKRESD